MTGPGLIAQVLLWTCAALVAYTYFIYPALLFGLYVATQMFRDLRYLLGRKDRRAGRTENELPCVSLVIAAYNEEKHLPSKLKNLRDLDYLQDNLEIIFVSDGSTDR